jgi:hypothetical protein
MAENYIKSKEEIALELFYTILSGKIPSGCDRREVLAILLSSNPSKEAYQQHCLTLYKECLNVVHSYTNANT